MRLFSRMPWMVTLVIIGVISAAGGVLLGQLSKSSSESSSPTTTSSTENSSVVTNTGSAVAVGTTVQTPPKSQVTTTTVKSSSPVTTTTAKPITPPAGAIDCPQVKITDANQIATEIKAANVTCAQTSEVIIGVSQAQGEWPVNASGFECKLVRFVEDQAGFPISDISCTKGNGTFTYTQHTQH